MTHRIVNSTKNTFLGLFPDIVLTSDSKRICFINLETRDLFVLDISITDCDLCGNVIIIKTMTDMIAMQIEDLITNGIVYRLSDCPIELFNNDLHAISDKTVFENKSLLSSLYLATIILDAIPELPLSHYPQLKNAHCFKPTGSSLSKDDVRRIVNQLNGFKRIRLLSSDIFRYDLYSRDFDDIELETIVDYQYFIRHIDDIATLKRQFSIIVDVKNISLLEGFNACGFINKNVTVTFCCQVNNIDELNAVSNIDIKPKPYLSNDISRQQAHLILNYSEEDLKRTRMSRRQLFLNKAVNTNFYGQIIIDNEGNINSYPVTNYLANGNSCIRHILTSIATNKYWCLTREQFFGKCSDCIFSIICPPLSSYEINLRETFCPY